MEGDYDACLNHLAAALGKYEPLLLPFASDSPDGGVRFEFALGPVLVQGVLRRNLSFEVEAKDSRVGPLVQAAHRLTGLPGFQEVLASALRQFETYAKGETENLDWSSQGVPWWDASKDEFLARDWLASREGAQASDDVDDRVLELTQTDLDPPRGWRLVKTIVEFANTDEQLQKVGREPLSTILSNHLDLVREELARLYESDPKWRKSFEGQISTALHEFKLQVERENRDQGLQ